MRTTIIPAQITTIEDRIAGPLTMTQMLLLTTPLLWGIIVYAFFPPVMHLAWQKLPLAGVVLVICFVLSLPTGETIVLHRLATWLRYVTRPRIYVPVKADMFGRTIDVSADPIAASTPRIIVHATPVVHKTVSFKDLVHFERQLTRKRFTIRYKTNGKGGLDVAYSPR